MPDTLIPTIRGLVEEAVLKREWIDASAIAKSLHATYPSLDVRQITEKVIQEAARAHGNVSWE